MEPLKVVIFVDGQNFKKNLQEFAFYGLPNPLQVVPAAPATHKFKLDEKHFLWQIFFRDILEKFHKITGEEYRLLRVYWYNADSVSPWYVNPRAVSTIVRNYGGRFPGLTDQRVIQLAKEWYARNKKNFYESRDLVYDIIQRDVDFIEFKYVGQFKLKPYQIYRFERDAATGVFTYFGTREGEKGVDIGLAIDMVSKLAGFDVAILVSGDADFHPAVRFVKDHLKQVFQFSVAKGVPPNISYLSPWLDSIVDVFAYFDEVELLGKYLNRKANIPQAVLRAIDQRIAALTPQPMVVAAPPPP